MTVELSPITDPDVAAVAEFLHANLNTRVPASAWLRAMSVPWKVDAPNHGFMLRDGQRVVGAYLAFYSERVVAGQVERFCNLGAWCVLPDFRFHSMRLLKALLAQDGYHFTDLSPSGSVVPLNTRLKFRSLDTSTALIPNLPWPTLIRRTRISADPKVIESTLAGADLELYRDHARAAAAHHLVLIRGSESCYVMFRKVTRKDLPVFAAILHVGNPELFRRAIRPADSSPAAPLPAPGHPGRAADRQAPAPSVGHAALAAAEDVPQHHPGTHADRRPLQRARVRTLVARAARSDRERRDMMRTQIHHLLAEAADARCDAPALTFKDITLSYAQLWHEVTRLRCRAERPGPSSR